MANKVTIDVEARFVDRVSAGMDSAAESTEKLEKAAKQANKELDKAGKKNVKPKLGADDNAFTKKIREAQSKAEKLGKTKVAATLGAVDKASAKIGSVTGAARAFASKVFKSSLGMADKASSVIGNVTGAARSFASKTYSAAVKIVDYATTPLRKIKESLFSIKTLVAAVTAGLATKKYILDPIGLADSYSSAQIGFSTLLGQEAGQAMMDDIDEFAAATPFKTSNVISNVQKMMAYGWDADRVISDMKTIGDAAAATGKGDEGLESIVYALSEIRSKGKLSTQELNQLASAGIKAKQYLAEGLGYGTDDAGLQALAKDLEGGAIGANQAVELILQGMKEFDGMMDKTANETVEGLWGQIEDTFEINIFRKWGQGLQDGAKKGLGAIVSLLDTSEEGLERLGELLYNLGKEISNWAADKLANTVEKIQEITASDTFKEASLGGKVKILWDEIIAEPFSEWWDGTGKPWIESKAQSIGEGLGSGITKGLLALLGIDVTGMVEEGAGIGASFGKGFAEGFDGSAITDALVDAISNVWNNLPGWAKLLIGGYGAGKIAGGISSFAGGIASFAGGVGKFIGSAGAGTGLLGLGANTAINMGLGNLAGGASLSAGALSALGLSAIAGGVATAASVGKGAVDLYGAYKAYKAGDKTEAKAKGVSGGTTLGGVAAGAAIGSIFGPVGTLVGAGIGGIAGWIGGNKMAKSIRNAKYESEEMQEALKNSEISAEELAIQMEKAVKANLADRFGELELTMEEISSLAKNIVFGDDVTGMQGFADAAEAAEKSLKNFQTAASDMERLNFDMQEHAWKLDVGIEEALSEEEIEAVKTRVQNYIDSAEALLSDQHYEFNAAVKVLLKPVEGEENTVYDQFITDGNSMFAKLQEQLDEQSQKLTAQYEIALEDGVITADEQKILSQIQAKIAEIMEKVSNAKTEASFTVSKLDFTMGDLTAESFQTLQSSLQSQLETYEAEQKEALTVAISEINLELKEGVITQDQYDSKLQELVDGYNTNIEAMSARVGKVQLEGISEAFDEVATVEQLQGAIEGVLADGKNPMEVTFDDINAHLGLKDDALSEETKTAFVEVMQAAIESAASGDSALTTTVEVDPQLQFDEKKLVEPATALKEQLESSLTGGEEGTTITPELSVSPELALQEDFAPELKSEVETQVSSYLTGENSINAAADIHVNRAMYGSGGISLSEEAAAGRAEVNTAISEQFQSAFTTTADAKITLDWQITNPSTTLSFSGGGGNGSTVKATVGQNANGGFINSKMLSWIGEEGPEAIIPLVPGRRARGLKLWEEAGRRLGVQYHAEGGIVGGDNAPIKSYEGDVTSGSGEQRIEVNMGGVTIEIKTDGSKSIAQNIEDQEQEIAEKVAAIFRNVFSAQFANTPLRGET